MLNYEVPVFGYLGRVTFNNSYRSGTYLNANQAEFTYQDAYNITNLGLGIGTEDGKYEVGVLAKNIFDEFYATSKSNLHVDRRFHVATRRAAVLRRSCFVRGWRRIGKLRVPPCSLSPC